jgi:hypothetical protein
MNGAAVDIKSIIEYYYADSSDVDLYEIFVGKEPAEPANCISIFETGIGSPQLTFDRSEIYEYTSVQIRVRTTNYLNGWSIINEIKNILHGRANETWGGGTIYTLIRCSVSPALLDYDKNQRVRFVVSFNIQRR